MNDNKVGHTLDYHKIVGGGFLGSPEDGVEFTRGEAGGKRHLAPHIPEVTANIGAYFRLPESAQRLKVQCLHFAGCDLLFLHHATRFFTEFRNGTRFLEGHPLLEMVVSGANVFR